MATPVYDEEEEFERTRHIPPAVAPMPIRGPDGNPDVQIPPLQSGTIKQRGWDLPWEYSDVNHPDEEEEYQRWTPKELPVPGPYGGYHSWSLGNPAERKFLYSQQREGGEEAFQSHKAVFDKQLSEQRKKTREIFRPPPKRITISLGNPFEQIEARRKRQQPEDRLDQPIWPHLRGLFADQQPFQFPGLWSNMSPPNLYGSQSPQLPTTQLTLPGFDQSGSMINPATGQVLDPRLSAWSPAQTSRWAQRLSPQQVWSRNEADQEMYGTPPAGSQTIGFARPNQINPFLSPMFNDSFVPWGYSGIRGKTGITGLDFGKREMDLRALDYLMGVGPDFESTGNPDDPMGAREWANMNRDVIVDRFGIPLGTWY